MQSILFTLLLLATALMSLPSAYAANLNSVNLADGTELQVHVYEAEGESLLIMFPSEHGVTSGLKSLAKALSHQGIEVWIADPFSTWFLPEVESSLAAIPVSAYAELMAHAEKTKKDLYIYSNDKGSRSLLEAAQQWQSNADSILSGAILVSPDLYKKTPIAGNDGEFLDVALTSNLPVFIFLPLKSTLALRISDTVSALEKGGSDIYTQQLKNVRNRFYFRQDATDAEQKMATNFAAAIAQGMRLTKLYTKPRKPVALATPTDKNRNKTSGALQKYRGQFRPDDFTLDDISGTPHSLSQYYGKVVVVNFWASWCPPCVHEMPSMSTLNAALKDRPFTILAINLGESPGDINKFLDKHPVNFPVLLDPQQTLPKKWNVFAYPTSYLLDKQGLVRYSVAGGIDWTSDDVIMAIDDLLAEEK